MIDPAAETVQVAGDFNGWDPGRTSLERVSADAWAVTITLEPGRYEYMFVIDGKRWIADPSASETKDDGFGSKNAVLDVNVVAGSAVVICDATRDRLVCIRHDAPAELRRHRARREPGRGGLCREAGAACGQRDTSVGVEFVLEDRTASSVAVSGSFNAWSTSSHPMARVGQSGRWVIVLRLPPGDHQFMFVVDGTRWVVPTTALDYVDDGFGATNAVVTVPLGAVIS